MNLELKITLWALTCIYAIGNFFIYSWTFWSAFDINILQFASFSETLPSILYTIAIPFTGVIIAFTAVDLWGYLKVKLEHSLDTQMSAKFENYKVFKSKAMYVTNALMVIGCIISIMVLYMSDKASPSSETFPWSDFIHGCIPLIISLVTTYFLIKETTFLSSLNFARTLIIFIICFMPSASHYWGLVNSKQIINGVKTFIVQSDGQCKSSTDTHYRYISSISDKVFALSLTDSSICIFKYNSLKLTPESSLRYMRIVSKEGA